MKLLINDANILIDIVKLNLAIEFTSLSFALYTTDFVLAELNDWQNKLIQNHVDSGKINLIVTDSIEDFNGISDLLIQSTGLSFEDCSVWYYTKKLSGTLLTGDGKLRKLATTDGVEVRGIIYILDQILKEGLISFETALEKIELLYQVNNRLPKVELDKRKRLWRNKKHSG